VVGLNRIYRKVNKERTVTMEKLLKLIESTKGGIRMALATKEWINDKVELAKLLQSDQLTGQQQRDVLFLFFVEDQLDLIDQFNNE